MDGFVKTDFDVDLFRSNYEYDARGGFLSIRSGKVVGLVKRGYRQIHANGENHYVHRLVWAWHHGRMPDKEIDHIDGNPANNRIENLRLASRSQNEQNKRAPKNGSSTGVRGVSVDKQTGKYKVQIGLGGRNFHIGRFSSIADAERAYKAAQDRMHEYAPR